MTRTTKRKPFLCLLLLVALMSSFASAQQEEEQRDKPSETPSTKTTVVDDFDVSNEDWGSYYDPQNIFCGKYDCYKILGFDYESYASSKTAPDTKVITKRYRQLSREWHPDKSKHRHAKERFVKIVRAYEVLTSKELRAEYDAMRYDQEAYFQKYGSSVLWQYAPQTDTTIVIVIILVLINVFSWYSQKHRWQMVASRFIKAAVEDWSPREGGTVESKQLREQALAVLAEREETEEAETNGDTTTTTTTSKANNTTSSKKKSSQKGAKKVSAKEKKRQEQEALEPIITELVNQIDDFGSGFHKPTWRDLFIVSLVKFPFVFGKAFVWQTKYWVRRLQNKELNEEEMEVLTRRAVGPVSWDHASDEDRAEMIKRKLWKIENLAEWKEEEEIKNLSAADQKYYNRLKKKGKLE